MIFTTETSIDDERHSDAREYNFFVNFLPPLLLSLSRFLSFDIKEQSRYRENNCPAVDFKCERVFRYSRQFFFSFSRASFLAPSRMHLKLYRRFEHGDKIAAKLNKINGIDIASSASNETQFRNNSKQFQLPRRRVRCRAKWNFQIARNTVMISIHYRSKIYFTRAKSSDVKSKKKSNVG